jgi:hypothetical protein
MSFLKVLEGVNLTLVEDELSLALSGDNVDKLEILLGPSEPRGIKYTTLAPQFQVQIHSCYAVLASRWSHFVKRKPLEPAHRAAHSGASTGWSMRSAWSGW